jgi:erythromycin esterase-like protein
VRQRTLVPMKCGAGGALPHRPQMPAAPPTPWQADPSTFGHAALTGTHRTCEPDVVRILEDLLRKRSTYAAKDAERFMDAVQNARLVADAERYYRIMYYGSRASWTLRDTHMFDTLQALLDFHGPHSTAIVWAHNSHVGNASATEMSARGEFNIGELYRRKFGAAVYSIGFGTNTGTVAAASEWDSPMEVKAVQPGLGGSYEKLLHQTGQQRFMLPLRHLTPATLRQDLEKPRLERAIDVIYQPETELASHYFQASLPRQFDETIWFDETRAVTPLAAKQLKGLPDSYPFGL